MPWLLLFVAVAVVGSLALKSGLEAPNPVVSQHDELQNNQNFQLVIPIPSTIALNVVGSRQSMVGPLPDPNLPKNVIAHVTSSFFSEAVPRNTPITVNATVISSDSLNFPVGMTLSVMPQGVRSIVSVP